MLRNLGLFDFYFIIYGDYSNMLKMKDNIQPIMLNTNFKREIKILPAKTAITIPIKNQSILLRIMM